jgi:glycosyltransferase involved in cell wall biosynthesis
MTLRICHIVSGDLWAGAEVMAFQLISGLNSVAGVEPCVIVLNEGKLSEQLKNAGIAVYVADETKLPFRRIVLTAAKVVRQEHPTVIHAHRYKENFLAYLVSKLVKQPAALVTTQHGMPEYFGSNVGILQRLKTQINFRLMASRFDLAVAVSRDIKNSLVSHYGLQESRVKVIRNGIAIPQQSRGVKNDNEFVVGSAGRFVHVKDYVLMVEIAKEVVAKSDSVRFQLAGEGPMSGQISELIEKYRLRDHFYLSGFLDDVNGFLSELDVYLNTSLHEGIPMSVLEAMALGLPVVAPKVGGLPEVIADGVDGYLVDTRDPSEYAEKLLALCRNKTQWSQISHAAREKIAREFSTQRMVNAYLDAYKCTVENVGHSKYKRWGS